MSSSVMTVWIVQDRRLVRSTDSIDRKYLDRLGDVFQSPRTQFPESDGELAFNLVVNLAGNEDSAGLRDCFEARRHVDAIAEDVVPIDDDVADIYADTKFDPLLLRHFGIAFDHPVLNVDGTAHGIDDTPELHQHAVAGCLHDPSAMLLNFGIDEGSSVGFQLGQSALFVGAHETAVSSDIGGEDRCEPSFRTVLGHGRPPIYT